MSTSVISNTITDPTGAAISGVPVTVTLMPTAGFRVSDASEVARTVSTTTNGSGVWSLSLEQTANITPSNTYYEVVEFIPAASGGTRVWTIQVGASSQTVSAALVTPLPAAQASGFLTQAAADARYQALGSFGSVVAETAGAAGTSGVSTAASRSDHVHAAATGTPVAIGTALSAGSAATFAASDHVHTGPLGTLPNGYAKVTTSQSSITTAVDLTGLSVTVTTVAGRRYRVTGKTYPSSSVAGDTVVMIILQDGAQLDQAQTGAMVISGGLQGATLCLSATVTPAAGSHTFKLQMARQSGTGTIANNASAILPSYILVEDIGT